MAKKEMHDARHPLLLNHVSPRPPVACSPLLSGLLLGLLYSTALASASFHWLSAQAHLFRFFLLGY